MKKNLLLSVMLCVATLLPAAVNQVNEEIQWPETMREWYVGMDIVNYLEIVYYEDGFYQCLEEDGAPAYSEGWSPKTTWAVPNYELVALARMWEVGMSHIENGEYIIYKDGVYQCIAPEGTDAWSEEYWSPVALPDQYTKICNIILVEKEPEPENPLPDNYIGYWYDNELSWKIGWTGLYEGKVWKCIANTHPNGGEYPGSPYGYWNTDALGEELELFSIEGITFPAWDDERSWPIGAIVAKDGIYYECLANTEKGAAQLPETATDFWKVLVLGEGGPGASVDGLQNDELNYTLLDGKFSIISNTANYSLELYSVAGQLITISSDNSVTLPAKGIYIVKANVDGKLVTVKTIW